MLNDHSNPYKESTTVLSDSITLTAKSSKKNERRQVNEIFHKLERGYSDSIKRTTDKTRIYSIPHDAPGA